MRQNAALLLVVFAVFGIMMTACSKDQSDRELRSLLTSEQQAHAVEIARAIADAPPFSLIEMKDGHIWVICAARYEPKHQPPTVVVHGTSPLDPMQPECNSDAQRQASGPRDNLGWVMPTTALLNVRRIAAFDKNNRDYQEVAARLLYEKWFIPLPSNVAPKTK